MGLFNGFFKEKRSIVCEPWTIYSPLKGEVIPLAEVEDPAFSQGLMGPGVGIEPGDGLLYAPVDGEIIALFPTKHAVGMKSSEGIEILIHIGIDTVEMNGEGFKTHVKQGDKVKAGTLLVEFDSNKIKKAGYKTTTMILVPNANSIGKLEVTSYGNKEDMEPLCYFNKEL